MSLFNNKFFVIFLILSFIAIGFILGHQSKNIASNQTSDQISNKTENEYEKNQRLADEENRMKQRESQNSGNENYLKEQASRIIKEEEPTFEVQTVQILTPDKIDQYNDNELRAFFLKMQDLMHADRLYAGEGYIFLATVSFTEHGNKHKAGAVGIMIREQNASNFRLSSLEPIYVIGLKNQ